MNINRFLVVCRFIRLPNLLTAASNVVMGGMVTGASGEDMLVAAGASMALYGAGVGWNDLRDEARDRTLHPDRPLPSGLLSRRHAWMIVGGLGGSGLLMAGTLGWRAFGFALAVTASIAAYNVWVKFHSAWGPLAMGLCRGFNVAMGLSLGTGVHAAWGIPAMIVGVMGYGITLCSLMEEDPAGWIGRTGVAVLAVLIGLSGWWLVQAGQSYGWLAPYAWLLYEAWRFLKGSLVQKLAPSAVGPWIGTWVRHYITMDAMLAGALVGWAPMLLIGGLWLPMIVLGQALTPGEQS